MYLLAGERSKYVAAVGTKTARVRSKLLLFGHKGYVIDDGGVYPGVDPPPSAPDIRKREGRNTPSVDIARLASCYRNSGHQSTLASVACIVSRINSSDVANGARQQQTANRGAASSELWIGDPCTYVPKQFTSEQDK